MTLQLQPVEQWSVTGVIQDLDRYGLPRKDPNLIKLVQAQPLASLSAPGLEIGVFISPHRISSGLRKSRTIWIGVVEITGGPLRLLSRLLVLKCWLADPSLHLVAAEIDLITLAQAEFP